MKYLYRIVFIFLCLYFPASLTAQIHHDLSVILQPHNSIIKVQDKIRISANDGDRSIRLLLHGNLKITEFSGPGSLTQLDKLPTANDFSVREKSWHIPKEFPLQYYELQFTAQNEDTLDFILSYIGKIHHEVAQLSQEYARGFSETPGIIDSQGVYLAGSSFWIPWFGDDLITFNLLVEHPDGWHSVSQGKRVDHGSRSVEWECRNNTEEVYLISAPFQIFEKRVGEVNVMAYLRSDDAALANKYLETTGQYLEMYRKLIGSYPYSKFALIENFWETGYGMPSFTLLGPKVIRFPFILHSSYPHELLHNWWGNGVYVDYSEGNWCEGLTVYLADQLIKEQRGQGTEYRRTALQAYTDYVNAQNEFPLIDFRSRTNAASSAIGYNKSMMIFHLLRNRFGDQVFIQAIQNFYRDHQFQRAGFSDIRSAFEAVSNTSLESFFEQWVERSGAPEIRLKSATVTQKEKTFELNFRLEQVQRNFIYNLHLPVAVLLEGEDKPVQFKIRLDSANQSYRKHFAKRPVQLEIDPEFDVFRRLDREEIPPSLSHIFGTQNVLIILPSADKETMQTAYASLAESWATDTTRTIKIVMDNEIDKLPQDQSIWLFGYDNKFVGNILPLLAEYNTFVTEEAIQFRQNRIALDNTSVVSVLRHPDNIAETVVWLRAGLPQALPGLSRKLPHYGKYGYLAFEGTEPTNIAKGQWPAVNSPLRHNLVGMAEIRELKYQERAPLADLAPVFSEEHLKKHTQFLADLRLEGRGFGSPGLDTAATYIAKQFKTLGLRPGGDNGTYYQNWSESGGPENKSVQLKNVVGIIGGKNPDWKDQSVVLCAHYDHLGLGWPDVRSGNQGMVHPGADDNASGVAVLLEVARIMAKDRPQRTVVFVAFTGEEAGLRGSKYYVQNAGDYAAEKIIGVLNLDTVGRLFNKKILIIGSSSAAEWKHIAMGVGFVTGIPNEIVSQELDASDQVSFIRAGIPAIQLFSGAHEDYHRPGDTVEKLDYPGMVRVASFAREIMNYLANERKDPMTFTGQSGESSQIISTHDPSQKRAATGIMPDFAFSGTGVKIASVGKGSAAAKAGLAIGDVLLAVDGNKIQDLRSYSALLKKYKPGDKVVLTYQRDQQEKKIELVLGSR